MDHRVLYTRARRLARRVGIREREGQMIRERFGAWRHDRRVALAPPSLGLGSGLFGPGQFEVRLHHLRRAAAVLLLLFALLFPARPFGVTLALAGLLLVGDAYLEGRRRGSPHPEARRAFRRDATALEWAIVLGVILTQAAGSAAGIPPVLSVMIVIAGARFGARGARAGWVGAVLVVVAFFGVRAFAGAPLTIRTIAQ